MNYIQRIMSALLVFGSAGIYGAQQKHITQAETLQQDLFQKFSSLLAVKYISDIDKKALIEELQALEQQIKALPTIKTIKGDMFLIFSPVYYITDTAIRCNKICDENGSPLPLKKNDVLVEVWACDDLVSQNWSDDGHNALGKGGLFPHHLPLSLLAGKKEGETVTFFLKNENNELVKVELTCKQRGYRYDFGYDFHEGLASLLRYFAEKPFVNPSCIDDVFAASYIEAGIVEKYIDADGNKAFRHGPNGFTLNQ